jgi:hypothetical protein
VGRGSVRDTVTIIAVAGKITRKCNSKILRV